MQQVCHLTDAAALFFSSQDVPFFRSIGLLEISTASGTQNLRDFQTAWVPHIADKLTIDHVQPMQFIDGHHLQFAVSIREVDSSTVHL